MTRSKSSPPEAVSEQLLEVVPRLMRIISAEAQSGDTGESLTTSQLRALGLMARRHRLPSELARAMGVSPATTTDMVDLLVRRGLVQRWERPGDRRATELRITPAGLDQHEAARRRALAALNALLDGIHPADLDALERGLDALSTEMSGGQAAVVGGGHAG